MNKPPVRFLQPEQVQKHQQERVRNPTNRFQQTPFPIFAGNGESQRQQQQYENNDVTAHAEILAIREAEKKLGNWRLNDCEMYVTLEPCPMCAWAILRSRIKSLTFGAYDTVYGAFSTLPQLQKMSNSTLKVRGGIMESECKQVIEEYFKDLR